MKTTMQLNLMLCLVIFPMQSHQMSLSMMTQSIDDMYDGCNEKMAEKVDKVYFPREIKNEPFKNGWNIAKVFAKTKYKNRPDTALTLEQVQAIYVYTQEFPNVYGPLNTILREGAAKYTTEAFPFHALHFWLTTALQIVKENKECNTTYRRSNIKFTGQVNREMRFGFFASSSKEPNLITFGKETCFHIQTCFGADIDFYSGKSESEVLIPPYEKFNITEIVEGSYGDMKDCKKTFVLKSTGKSSNLNCKAI